MSSRTNSGKKRREYNPHTSMQHIPRPQVIQVRLSQPQPQIVEMKEEKEKENDSSLWSILRESSLVLGILSAILFMIGWSYISNWYAYFGIGMDQVNIPFQQVVLFSALPIAYSLSFALIYYFLIFQIKFLLVKSGLVRSKLITENELFIASFILIGFSYVFATYITYSTNRLSNESTYVGVVGIGMFFPLMLSLFYKKETPHWPKIVLVRWLTLAGCASLLIMYVSSLSALFDASDGKRGYGGSIPRVFLMSPVALPALKEVESSCEADGTNCRYGSFGLVLEKEKSLFLAVWKQRESGEFRLLPNIYIVPREDANGPYFVVPDSSSTIVSQATQADTIAPTPAPTIASTPLPTTSQP